MKYQPLYDHVIIKTKDASTQTAGGIIIPNAAQDAPKEGEVLAVGCGHIGHNDRPVPLIVQKGDTVLFNEWAGTEIKDGDQDLKLMKESDILAIIKS